MPKESKKYKTLVGLNNDKTGKRYEPEDIITTKDFSKTVLEHWAEQGRIIEITD